MYISIFFLVRLDFNQFIWEGFLMEGLPHRSIISYPSINTCDIIYHWRPFTTNLACQLENARGISGDDEDIPLWTPHVLAERLPYGSIWKDLGEAETVGLLVEKVDNHLTPCCLIIVVVVVVAVVIEPPIRNICVKLEFCFPKDPKSRGEQVCGRIILCILGAYTFEIWKSSL